MSQVKKINNPFIKHKGDQYNCIGCSPNNKTGFQLEFYSDGESVYSYWIPKVEFEGYMNVVHGGIQATLMDELASWFVYSMLDTAGVTSKMEIQYHNPLYISAGEMKITARLISKNKKHALIETEIENSKGVVCSSAIVEYYLFPPNVARVKYNYPGKDKFWGI